MSEQVITVSGLREVQKSLYAYSQQMGDRVVRGALRQGANYVLRGIREAVPVKTGLLRRRGFRVANSRIHNGRLSSSLIGLYIGLRKKKGDPFYGRFQNDGFRVGNTKVPGKGFVQRAFAERREAAVQLVIQSAEAGAEVVKRKVGLK
jgi:hypothetical protein